MQVGQKLACFWGQTLADGPCNSDLQSARGSRAADPCVFPKHQDFQGSNRIENECIRLLHAAELLCAGWDSCMQEWNPSDISLRSCWATVNAPQHLRP